MSLTTPAVINAHCQEEESQRAALPRMASGQVADSYDTLHGVRFIDLIHKTTPATLSDHERLEYALYLHDVFLAENLKELFERAGRALSKGEVDAAADHLTWASRLLRLKHDGDGLFADPIESAATDPVAPALSAAFEALCAALFEQLQTTASTSASVLGLPCNADARLFQLAKTLVLQMKEMSLAGRKPPSEVNIAVVDAHRRCVIAASRGIDLNRDTYLNQFCLLHQLPELLTPLILRRFDLIEAALSDADFPAALLAARTGGDLLQLIVSSLWPLIELLYPAQYYAFRENLGATSGSSSAAIRGKLLTEAYVRLGKATLSWADRRTEHPTERALTVEIARIRSLIYRWRGLHMALPRNVLGANGTKSLMGSPDALKAVEAMAESFQKKDPLSNWRPFQLDEDVNSAAAVLDRWLLAATGEVAQQRFRQVQERTGTWERSKKLT